MKCIKSNRIQFAYEHLTSSSLLTSKSYHPFYSRKVLLAKVRISKIPYDTSFLTISAPDVCDLTRDVLAKQNCNKREAFNNNKNSIIVITSFFLQKAIYLGSPCSLTCGSYKQSKLGYYVIMVRIIGEV